MFKKLNIFSKNKKSLEIEPEETLVEELSESATIVENFRSIVKMTEIAQYTINRDIDKNFSVLDMEGLISIQDLVDSWDHIVVANIRSSTGILLSKMTLMFGDYQVATYAVSDVSEQCAKIQEFVPFSFTAEKVKSANRYMLYSKSPYSSAFTTSRFITKDEYDLFMKNDMNFMKEQEKRVLNGRSIQEAWEQVDAVEIYD